MQLTVKFQSDRSYLATWQGKIIARYELLKTRPEARLKSVYLGAKSMPEAQTIARTITDLFKVRVEIRTAQRCSTAFEVVVRGIKVAVMAAIEKFVLALITAAEMPAAPTVFNRSVEKSKVIPLQPMRVVPLGYRPDQQGDRVLVASGGHRLSID